MPSLPEPPDDQSENRQWIDEQAERVAVLARSNLRRIILRAYDAYVSTLTAAGDLAAFDSIPQEWGVFVGEQLLDEIDGVYRSGAVAAWNQAPTTAALGTQSALAWAAVVNEDAISYAAQASNRLAGVGTDVWLKVNSEVTEAIRKGTGTEALKEEIERLTSFSEFRADTIARTEIGSAFVNGNYEAQKALGEYGPAFKEWLSVADARTRPEHAALDGTVIPFDDMFDAGGEMMRAPHDETASAANVVNCRCDVLYYYPGDTLPDGTLVEVPGAQLGDEQGTAGPEVAEEVEQAAAQIMPDDVLGVDRYEPARMGFDDFAGQWTDVYEKGGGPYGDLDPRGDQHLAELWRRQGFDALPQVVNSDRYNALVDEGWRPIHRGLAADTMDIVDGYIEQFIAGSDPFVGKGLFGSGTYAAEALDTAETFTRQTASGKATQTGKVLNMALRPDARVIDIADIYPQMQAVVDNERAFVRSMYAKYKVEDWSWDELRARVTAEELVQLDEVGVQANLLGERPSNWATVHGYDAIRIERPRVRFSGTDDDFVEDTYWIILNRGALAVKEPT